MKKIKNIKDFTKKSFKGYSGPENEFSDKSNIFFGHSGHGKSSLALGIYENFIGLNDKDDVRLYNESYSKNTLLIKEGSGEIKGVVADFGNKNVKLQENIIKLEDDLVSLEEKISKKEAGREETGKNIRAIIEEVVKRRKGKTSTKNKSHNDGLRKVVQLWEDDYKEAKKKFPDENFSKIDGDDDFTVNLDAISNLYIPVFEGLDQKKYEGLGKILLKSYGKEAIPDKTTVEWLINGLHIHNGKKECGFCLNKMDYQEVEKRVKSFASNEEHIAQKTISNHFELFDTTNKELMKLLKKEKHFLAILDDNKEVKDALNEIRKNIKVLNINMGLITDKIKGMSKSIQFDQKKLGSTLEKINQSIETISSIKIAQKKLYQEKINRLDTLVRGAIGFEIKNNKLLNESLQKYITNQKEMDGFEKDIGAKKEEIKNLKEKKSDLSGFAEYINKVFDDIGIDFHLEVFNDKAYVLKHRTFKVELTIDDISPGERNILSLIYFYYEMLNDNQKDLKKSISVVIVDDPATSMDDENKFYILEIIKSLINNTSIQSFIFTHSWSDYCDLCYGKNSDTNVKMFEIKKKAGMSEILPTKPPVRPYKKLYIEINNFMVKDPSSIVDEDFLHMPNTMRRVLEEYLKFNYDISPLTSKKITEVAKILFDKEFADLTITEKNKTQTLLSVCNILSHRVGASISKKEIHDSARFLIERIKSTNQYHHEKMVN